MTIRFSSVQEIQFINAKGKPLKATPRICSLAQELDNQGSKASPPFGVFTLSDTCGDPNNTYYLVYNGPQDTDGDTFHQQSIGINQKYLAKLPLTEVTRNELIAEKTALFHSYLAKASGVVQVKTQRNKPFEILA
jgi:hypothetical protein